MPGILFRKINDKNLLFVPEDFFAGKGIAEKVFRKLTTPQLLSAYIREILSLIVAENSLAGSDNSADILPVNLKNEFIYRVVLALNRIDNVLKSPDISFTAETWEECWTGFYGCSQFHFQENLFPESR